MGERQWQFKQRINTRLCAWVIYLNHIGRASDTVHHWSRASLLTHAWDTIPWLYPPIFRYIYRVTNIRVKRPHLLSLVLSHTITLAIERSWLTICFSTSKNKAIGDFFALSLITQSLVITHFNCIVRTSVFFYSCSLILRTFVHQSYNRANHKMR